MCKKLFNYILLICGLLAATGCSRKEPAQNKADAPDSAPQAVQAAPVVDKTGTSINPLPAPKVVRSEACPAGAFKTKDGVCSCYYGAAQSKEKGRHDFGELRSDDSDVLGAAFQCADIDCGTGSSSYAICANIR